MDVPSEADYAALLAHTEQRMTRADIADALEVDEQTLDEIASGYMPNERVAARLQELAEDGRRRVRFHARSVSVWLLVAFVACDVLFFGIAMLVFLLYS